MLYPKLNIGTDEQTDINTLKAADGLWYDPNKLESYFVEMHDDYLEFTRIAYTQLISAYLKSPGIIVIG